MLFNSYIFLYLFLPITYVVYWRLKQKNQHYIWLTIASYVFYGYWNYKFCFWMALSTLISFGAGLGLRAFDDSPKKRKFFLILPIAIDILILGIFKYTNFILGSFQDILNRFNAPVQFPILDIILPVGISFYTFHTISYIVDSYRRVVTPTRNFWEFSCYVSLFSQLVAGPIVRFRQIEDDLENIDHADRRRYVNIGWSFFVIGMIKKVVLADSIASIIDPALKTYLHLSSVDTWLSMLGYTYQLYFDFSGYSDMAVGLGYLFGLKLPQNFNSPYQATSIADFWRRWHISLSSCLRDYLYIPLGGNRGDRWFLVRNLMITMLLGGLWHGAKWTFVIWGAYHGFLLVLNKEFENSWGKLPEIFQQTISFILVVIGWVFFRSDDLDMARVILKKMFFWTATPASAGFLTLTALLIICAFIAHRLKNTFEMEHTWKSPTALGFAGLFILCLVIKYGGHSSPFLYFQF